MAENRYSPYTDMNKREFGALSSSDAYPSFFVAEGLPEPPEIPQGYTGEYYTSMQARFGRDSVIATPQEIEWASHYNSQTNTWDTDDKDVVPEEFKIVVADYRDFVLIYPEILRVYNLTVFTMSTAQWRLYISDAILDISQP